MSFDVNVSGHSPSPHNDEVKAATYEFVKRLKALGGTVSVTGYTYDSSGVNFQLNDAFIADEELREKAASAPAEETAADSTVEVPGLETTTQPPAGDITPGNVPAPEPEPAPDSTESAPTAPAEGA